MVSQTLLRAKSSRFIPHSAKTPSPCSLQRHTQIIGWPRPPKKGWPSHLSGSPAMSFKFPRIESRGNLVPRAFLLLYKTLDHHLIQLPGNPLGTTCNHRGRLRQPSNLASRWSTTPCLSWDFFICLSQPRKELLPKIADRSVADCRWGRRSARAPLPLLQNREASGSAH